MTPQRGILSPSTLPPLALFPLVSTQSQSSQWNARDRADMEFDVSFCGKNDTNTSVMIVECADDQ